MWSQQAISEAQMGRESRYGVEGWNQGAQEDCRMCQANRRETRGQSVLRMIVLGLVTCSSMFLCHWCAFLKQESEEEPFGDCLFGAMKTCNNFSISSGLSLSLNRFLSRLPLNIPLAFSKGRQVSVLV